MTILSQTHWMAHTAPILPVQTLDVFMAECPPIMDGITDTCYGETQRTDWIYPDNSFTIWTGPEDFSAAFQLCWDPDYLYMHIQLTDEYAYTYWWDSVVYPHLTDGFDIFLQLDTCTVPGSYGTNTVNLRVCRGLDSVQLSGHAGRSDFGYFTDNMADTGWVAEIAVPWTAVYSEGDIPENIMEYADSKVIGFDILTRDVDNEGSIWCYKEAWDLDGQDGTETEAENNTRVFGYITLRSDSNFLATHPKLNTRSMLFPNPTSGKAKFPDLNNACLISIFDIQGHKLLDHIYQPGDELDISELKPGFYIAVIEGRESIRFVKQ